MSIRKDLKSFDGRHTGSLEMILSKHPRRASLIGELVVLMADPDSNIQAGATWLLKRLVEDEVRFKQEHLTVLFGALRELTSWISKLHVCQMLPRLAIPKESAGNVTWFLERNLEDENKFLRAWSYNGFYELARQHREYFDEAIKHVEMGETDRAASVQARIRRIRKAMAKLRAES